MVTTHCKIPDKQNAEPQVRLLAAASEIYGRAKVLSGIQFAVTVPAALVSSLLMAWKPDWKVWLTFFSVTVALVDVLWLNRKQMRLKKQAATVQQMFDCELFNLQWRALRCGKRVDTEDVAVAAERFLKHPNSRRNLTDWYPPILGKLPLRLARLVCQRASIWWDLRQRDRVQESLGIILSVLIVLVFLIALLRGNTVEQMILTVYVPLAPAVIWSLREIFAQRDAVQTGEKALNHVESMWNQALEGKLNEEELREESLLIQDGLFDSRSRNPLVFDWVYSLLRSGHQSQMKLKADELVAEAQRRLKLPDSMTGTS